MPSTPPTIRHIRCSHKYKFSWSRSSLEVFFFFSSYLPWDIARDQVVLLSRHLVCIAQRCKELLPTCPLKRLACISRVVCLRMDCFDWRWWVGFRASVGLSIFDFTPLIRARIYSVRVFVFRVSKSWDLHTLKIKVISNVTGMDQVFLFMDKIMSRWGFVALKLNVQC